MIESHPTQPRIYIGKRWYEGVRLTDLGCECARLLSETPPELEKVKADLEALTEKLNAVLKRAEMNAEWEVEWRELRRREVTAAEVQATALRNIASLLAERNTAE